MLPNRMISAKMAQEVGKAVGPIKICCNDILFDVWEGECRTPVRKTVHPLERKDQISSRSV
jgi:hypothetical protein